MHAPVSSPAFHDRTIFERNLTRALVLGVGLGVGAEALGGLMDLAEGTLGVAGLLLGLGLAVSVDAGDRLDRALLCGLSLIPAGLVLFADTLTSGRPWGLYLAATALLGLLPVHAQRCRTGIDGGLARARPTGWHSLVGAAATSLLSLVGILVASTHAGRLEDLGAPHLLQFLAFAVSQTLFTGLAALTAHLWLAPDPIERRAGELERVLPTSLVAPVKRALDAYRACGALLAQLPRDPVRDELAQAVSQLTVGVLDGAEAWANLEAHGDATRREKLELDAARLAERVSNTQDPLTRGHLERAAQSLREEAHRLREIEVERERELARLEADAGQLEQARVALLGASTRSAKERLSDVEALSRRLRTLSAIEYGTPVLLSPTDEPTVPALEG